MTRTSAIERLRELPAVFSLAQLAARTGGDKSKASVYLARWKQAGLVDSFGPRTGIFFNLLVAPAGKHENSLVALKMLFPSAIIIGASVLHDSGWTTQVPRLTEVAVLSKPTLPKVDGFEIHPRSMAWYRKMHGGIVFGEMPRLKPEYALVDAWAFKKMWHPDIDDLEEDEINWPACKTLFESLELPWPEQYPEPKKLRMTT